MDEMAVTLCLLLAGLLVSEGVYRFAPLLWRCARSWWRHGPFWRSAPHVTSSRLISSSEAPSLGSLRVTRARHEDLNRKAED
jgi:hypothetical protein